MRIVFEEIRPTRKGNGIIATVREGDLPVGQKIWAPLAGAEKFVNQSTDMGVVVAESAQPTDDGWLVFVNEISRLALRYSGAPQRVIRDGLAKTEVNRHWREMTIQPSQSRSLVDLGVIRNLVRMAQDRGAKRVSFKFQDANGQPIKIHLGRDGSLVLSDGGPFGDNRFYGKVQPGRDLWKPTRAASEDVVEAVKTFNADPAAVAKLSGQLTGECCFCGRLLETRESVSAGYGPVCAENFGLPWGEVSSESGIAHVREQIADESRYN